MTEDMHTDWKPRGSDIRWARLLVDLLRDGGHWVAPIIGDFVIDKQAKTFVLLSRSPGYKAEVHRQTVKCFAAIGYEVSENAPAETQE